LAATAVLGALALTELGLRAIGLGHPILYDNRSAYGYRPLPNQSARRLWGARVHINNLGVRGPDVSPRRAPDAVRVLFLGDSVTYGGSYVDDADVFSAVAAAHLASRRAIRVEALNAGVNGWGAQNVLGLLRATGGFDSTVWVITALADDVGREKTHVGEVPYFNAPPRLASEEVLVLAAYKVLTAYKRPKPPADLAPLARRNLGTYRLIAALARARGARVLFVWHPQEDVLGGAPDPHKAAFLAMAAAAGAPALDLTAAYARAAAGRLYVDGLHLTPAGHAVAGRVIGEQLADLVASER
jgi:lysophospholipase L1-like esterase